VIHHTEGVVNVLNLVEGREVVIESPDYSFGTLYHPLCRNVYCSCSCGAYTITPHGESAGKECATIKAGIRTEMISHKVLK
jgi:hypothetical protein